MMNIEKGSVNCERFAALRCGYLGSDRRCLEGNAGHLCYYGDYDSVCVFAGENSKPKKIKACRSGPCPFIRQGSFLFAKFQKFLHKGLEVAFGMWYNTTKSCGQKECFACI